MPEEPRIKALSHTRRTWLFRSRLLVVLLLLPVVIFYTSGYRLSFGEEQTSIITTGGIYISTDNTNVQVYLNEEQYTRPRFFLNAYYLQNILAGQHRVVVQADGVHTWVKELPVDPHIVTEASAFNVPTTPRLRPITRYQSAGAAVYLPRGGTLSSTCTVFGNATFTEPFVLASSTTATDTYTVNPEYTFIRTLFASSTSERISVFADNAPEPRFKFATDVAKNDNFTDSVTATPTTSSSTAATSSPAPIEQNNIVLLDRGWEVYARWQGRESDIPYYFCVSSSSHATTSARYGEHVAEQVWSLLATSSTTTQKSHTTTTTTDEIIPTTAPLIIQDNRRCRTEIKLDHLREDVYAYNFVPGRSGVVLLHLQSGLYATEIDDRAWQNTQPLLLGDDFRVLLSGGTIYIERAGYYFALETELNV